MMVLLSEKIRTLALNNLWHANVGTFLLSYAVIPSFHVSVLFINPYFLLKFIMWICFSRLHRTVKYSIIVDAWFWENVICYVKHVHVFTFSWYMNGSIQDLDEVGPFISTIGFLINDIMLIKGLYHIN